MSGFGMSEIVLPLLKITHVIFWLAIYIGAFVSNNRRILATIIMCLVLVFYSWIISGECPLTTIESYFGEKEVKSDDGTRRSFISVFLENMGLSAQMVQTGMSTAIVLLIALCLYKMI